MLESDDWRVRVGAHVDWQSGEDSGIEGEVSVRDLWKHKDEGKVSKLSVELGPRACKVLKLTK